VQPPCPLEVLDLSQNDLRDIDILPVAEGLKFNAVLRVLDIGRNLIGPDGVMV
jgi:hypothetical protein